MSEPTGRITGNGSTAAKPPAGPLAQAVRGGANVGAVERPPLSAAAKAAPAVEGLKGAKEITSEAVKAQLKVLLSSPNPEARLKALKIAKEVATPDMAADILLCCVFDSNLLPKITESIDASKPFNDKLRQSNAQGNNEINKLRAEVFSTTVGQIYDCVKIALLALFSSDPVATVDSLAPKYTPSGEVLIVNRLTIEKRTGQRLASKLINSVLVESDTPKHPCLLCFADKLTNSGLYEEAAEVITALKLPEGVERLAKLAEAAKEDLPRNTQLGLTFLKACEAIGTPECLPLLDAVIGNPALHERMVEVTAKILQIDMA